MAIFKTKQALNPLRHLTKRICKFHGITNKKFKKYSNIKRQKLHAEYIKRQTERKNTTNA